MFYCRIAKVQNNLQYLMTTHYIYLLYGLSCLAGEHWSNHFSGKACRFILSLLWILKCHCTVIWTYSPPAVKEPMDLRICKLFVVDNLLVFLLKDFFNDYHEWVIDHIIHAVSKQQHDHSGTCSKRFLRAVVPATATQQFQVSPDATVLRWSLVEFAAVLAPSSAQFPLEMV